MSPKLPYLRSVKEAEFLREFLRGIPRGRVVTVFLVDGSEVERTFAGVSLEAINFLDGPSIGLRRVEDVALHFELGGPE